jgi:hypothetical protein
LLPAIRKYYNCNNIKAVTNPAAIKRPWLSIIKTLLKTTYDILVEDDHFTDYSSGKSEYIHTQRYTFTKKNTETSNHNIVEIENTEEASTDNQDQSENESLCYDPNDPKEIEALRQWEKIMEEREKNRPKQVNEDSPDCVWDKKR